MARKQITDASAVIVRPARAADAQTMTSLVREAYAPYVGRIGREPAPMTVDYREVAASEEAWVAEDASGLVGLIILTVSPEFLQVENVAVARSARGLGLGARLLNLAEDEARRRGLSEIRLYTNEAMSENLAYYPRRGYRETHRAYDCGFQRVYFVKDVH